MTVTVVPSHITIDENGVVRIGDTRMKVRHLVEAWKAEGATPEQLLESFPHLTLAQIHAALSYYYDHQAEMDAEIERSFNDYLAARAGAEETPGRKKLRDLGLRP